MNSRQFHSNIASAIAGSQKREERPQFEVTVNQAPDNDNSEGFAQTSDQSPTEGRLDVPGARYSRSSVRFKTALDKIPDRFRLQRSNSRIIEMTEEAPPEELKEIYVSPCLKEYISVLPNLKLLFGDIERRPHEWKKFVYQSLTSYKPPVNNTRTFPQMPSLHESINDSFNAMELLAIVKYLRPDAVESFLEGLVGEVRSKKYFLQPRTNFETHSRINWHRRPTIFFFGSSSRNPSQHIEVLAQRFNRVVSRIAFGEYNISSIYDDITKAASSGYWLIIENLHLLNKNTLTKLIKKIDEELEGGEFVNDNFKVWITYHTATPTYQGLNFKNDEMKSILEPFFKSCLKIFYNRADSVRGQMIDTYREKLSDYYNQIESEMSDSAFSSSTKSTMQQNLQKYRFKLQLLDKIDLHEFYERKLPRQADPNDSKKQSVMPYRPNENIAEVLSFKLKFVFSVLKCRFRHERGWPIRSHKYSDTYFSDHDITDAIEDLSRYLLNFKGNKQKFIEKYLIYYYNCSNLHFTTFSAPVVVNFIKDLFRKAEESEFVKV